MKKLISIFTVCVVSVFALTTANVFASKTAITNVELAEVMVKTLDLKFPAGTENLSDNEYFEVIGNILAARGIPCLLGKKANTYVTAGDLADILYAMLGKKDSMSADGKIKFLVAQKYMLPIDSTSKISFAYAVEILGHPDFASFVAEAYGESEGMSYARDVGIGAPGMVAESTASQT